ncbi:MAG: type II and III secretion system protein family protein [Hyphomicrobiaceae bacterium]|nr:type II and III secretion system protein family protein [Hyphomicrobiaceae bacterium]MCC0022696.1 type II and III secretion system protein family protein [Hyphomicrobiaceae bacterium]
MKFKPVSTGSRKGFVRAALMSLALSLAVPFAATPVLADASLLRIGQYGTTQNLQLGLNKSMIVDLPAEVSEVIVSQPQIAAAIMRDKRRAILQGVASGDTNILFLDSAGRQIATLNVSVMNDASSLSATLARVIPGSHIKVDSFGERIVLSGTARSSEDVTNALAIAAQFAGNESNVASIITVDGSQQVMLKVTVAEVSREVVKQLGIDLDVNLNLNNLATSLLSAPALGGASNVIANSSAGVSLAAGGVSIDATLHALERRGAMRTLAEPTLTALSGQEAEFLAGGQFPVPVGVDNGVISFEFKQFGVNLKFTPTVRSNGVIALQLETDVSEPTTEGGFVAGDITIPATKDRTAKTSVEMPSGSTLAIAGLIEDKVRQQFNELPGISNVPILGALFRSRDFIRSQTELVILVTPYLAAPGNRPRLPTDNLEFAGDAESVFLGHMQRLYGVGEQAGQGQYNGTVGFLLD